MRKKTVIFIILIILGLFTYRLIEFTRERFFTEEREEVSRRIPVKAVAVKKMDMVLRKRLTGDIIGTEVVNVFSHVPGKIYSIHKKEGQRVQKGSTIFKINRDIVGMEYKLAIVESPITGFIGEIMADRGMTVTPATPLAQVVNMSTVEALVRIMEEDINRIHVGMKAFIKVEAFPDEIFTGRVYKKSAVINEMSRTQEVRIIIKNRDLRLKHGMFADIEILLGRRDNALVVPEDSIIMNVNKDPSIYKVIENKARLQIVSMGITTNNYTEIIKGLSEGDIVITLGHENVTDGDDLIVYMEDIGD